jgi:hypothetical protein
MDPVLAIGTSPALPRAWAVPAIEATPVPYPPPPLAEPDPAAPAHTVNGGDPAGEQGLVTHFISHVNAACFVSLLQILDPMPDDERKRAEYRRYYSQLRESLQLPPPPPSEPG